MQVRDYRKCSSEAGVPVASGDALPSIHRVQLRMSLENVVKDIPSISDHGWTYGDLMVSEPIFSLHAPEGDGILMKFLCRKWRPGL